MRVGERNAWPGDHTAAWLGILFGIGWVLVRTLVLVFGIPLVAFFQAVRNAWTVLWNSTSSYDAARIVIVGAGFAGSAAARSLGWECTIIDDHDAMTFTPSLPRTWAGSRERVSFPHDRRFPSRVSLIRGRVELVTRSSSGGELSVRYTDGIVRHVPYDVLVIAVGSAPLALPDMSLEGHCEIMDAHEPRSLQDSVRHVLIAGGGSSGVELAMELAAAGRMVTLVHSGSQLLPGELPWVVRIATEALLSAGVRLVLNTRLVSYSSLKGGYVLSNSEVIVADGAVWCGGYSPQIDWITAAYGSGSALGGLSVTPELRLAGHDRVFIAGDAISGSLAPPKLAQVAEILGSHVAMNVRRELMGLPLRPFAPKVYPRLLSLGPNRSLFLWGSWAFDAGYMGAVLKILVHWKWLISQDTFGL